MRIAIIGCGGFIGSHLLDALLLGPEFSVVGFDTQGDKIASHLQHPRFTFHLGDAYTHPSLDTEIAAADVVIGLAAMCNPSQYNIRGIDVIESNFILPRRIADHCARLGKWLIQFSTSEVYGQTLAHRAGMHSPDAQHYVLHEDTSPLLMGPAHEQRWSYACAKQLLERYVLALHREKGLPYTLIRPFNFLGTRMDYLPGHDGEGVPRVLACFTGALIDKSPLTLVDGGHAKRTFLAIEEAVGGVLAMLRQPERAQNRIFNLGNPNNEVTIRELAETMRQIAADITGDAAYLELPLIDVPALEFYGEGYADSDRRMPDISKAQQHLGFAPKMTLPEMLRVILIQLFETYGTSRTGTSTKASFHA